MFISLSLAWLQEVLILQLVKRLDAICSGANGDGRLQLSPASLFKVPENVQLVTVKKKKKPDHDSLHHVYPVYITHCDMLAHTRSTNSSILSKDYKDYAGITRSKSLNRCRPTCIYFANVFTCFCVCVCVCFLWSFLETHRLISPQAALPEGAPSAGRDRNSNKLKTATNL